MNIIQRDPWTLMNRLHRDLDRLVANGGLTDSESNNSVTDWVPAVDVAEAADGFVIRADLPGVSPEDVEITMENGVLTLKGSRETVSESEAGGYKRVERSSGRFYRRFTLPDTSDSEGIEAKAKDGVLEIRIPKKPQLQPRRIKVNT